MTVGKLKGRLANASDSAKIVGVDTDGIECEVIGVRIEDSEVYLSLEEVQEPEEEEDAAEAA